MPGDSSGSGSYWILQGLPVHKKNKRYVHYIDTCNQTVLNVNANVMMQRMNLLIVCVTCLDFKMVNAMRVLDRHNEVPAVWSIRSSRSGYQDGIRIFCVSLESLPAPGRSASFYRDGFPPPLRVVPLYKPHFFLMKIPLPDILLKIQSYLKINYRTLKSAYLK